MIKTSRLKDISIVSKQKPQFLSIPINMNGSLSLFYIAAIISLAITLVSCSTLSNYTIEPLTKKNYPETKKVIVIEQEPETTYTVIAKFSGTENNNCRPDNELCSFRERAKEAGADAIWIKEHEVFEQADRWIMVKGKMTQLYAYREDRYQGVLIRYIEQ